MQSRFTPKPRNILVVAGGQIATARSRIVHVDGSFSKNELLSLDNTLKIAPTDLQTMKNDCMTSPKKRLKYLQTQSENYDAVMVLVTAAYIAKADGEIKTIESKRIENSLETFNKKLEVLI